jgi:hypothetical protein
MMSHRSPSSSGASAATPLAPGAHRSPAIGFAIDSRAYRAGLNVLSACTFSGE